MKYYRIISPDEGKNIMMKRDSHREVYDTSGIAIDENKIELPFKIKMFAGEESGYDQYDPDFEGEYIQPSIEERLKDYYSLSSLMTPALIHALREVGVDNLQVFPVEIEDAFTGEVLNFKYTLVNIVGLVSCANLETSESEPFGSGYYFHKIKIDEEKVKGLSMFRLAESHLEIIVDEKVAKIINSEKFSGIAAELCI